MKSEEKMRPNKECACGNSAAKEAVFSSISAKSFLMVVVLLTSILFICGFLTYVVPQGSFDLDESGTIIVDSFELGEIKGISLWRVLTAPFRVFASEDSVTIIMISVFLLIMSGVFNLLEKTNGTCIFISKVVRKFSNKKRLVVCIAVFLFMLFGSFFGMFEELVTLLPLVIFFMLSMGFDTLTGLGACMLAACFGFSAAITNPFSVGLVAEIAGTHVMDGLWLRLIFFFIVFGSVCAFLLTHIRKISKNPQKSLTYEIDLEKLQTLDFSAPIECEKERKIFKVFATFFAVQFVVLLLIASVRPLSGLAVPILSVSFLIGGIVSGLCVCENKRDVAKHMVNGAISMLPAVILIAIASSVKLVMSEGGILDTIMNGIIKSLSGKDKFLCIILIYLMILFLQVFIGSSSAKIMLIMPIMIPVCNALGISTTVVTLTYCMADGFTDMILPTNPVLLIGLSMAKVPYGKWFRWTFLFQIIMFVITVLILLFAVAIGY